MDLALSVFVRERNSGIIFTVGWLWFIVKIILVLSCNIFFWEMKLGLIERKQKNRPEAKKIKLSIGVPTILAW
jgi:hypothetical protein